MSQYVLFPSGLDDAETVLRESSPPRTRIYMRFADIENNSMIVPDCGNNTAKARNGSIDLEASMAPMGAIGCYDGNGKSGKHSLPGFPLCLLLACSIKLPDMTR